MELNPNIFRAYDIRGVMDVDLNLEVYYLLGRAYATMLVSRNIVLCPVGFDCRKNSREYADEFIRGLNLGGVSTVNFGETATPIIYFSSYLLKTPVAAMITSSHLPKETNGLKLNRDYSEPLTSSEFKTLYEIIKNQEFSTGQGSNETKDITSEYSKAILEKQKLKKKWRVVVDGLNGAAGSIYSNILSQMGCEVIEKNCQPNGEFPLGNPDPLERNVIERLSSEVVAEKADIGFAFDADGDRLAVTDNLGDQLSMNHIISLFAIDSLDHHPKSSVVYNTLCSPLVEKVILSHGGMPVVSATGRSFLRQAIEASHASFGGEYSGHLFFVSDFYGHDDPLYASIRLLAFIENKKSTLSDLTKNLPQYYSTPEIKIGLSDDLKFTFSERILPTLQPFMSDAIIDESDGISLKTEDTYLIIRPSQNGPYITIRLDSTNQDKFNQLRQKLKSILLQFPELDWRSGTNLSALD